MVTWRMENGDPIPEQNAVPTSTSGPFGQCEPDLNTHLHPLSMRLDGVTVLSDAISDWRSWDDIEVTMEAQIVLGED